MRVLHIICGLFCRQVLTNIAITEVFVHHKFRMMHMKRKYKIYQMHKFESSIVVGLTINTS